MALLSTSHLEPLWTTVVLVLLICLCPEPTGGHRNHTDKVPGVEQNETAAEYVEREREGLITAAYNVTVCETGYGYPDQCPQPGDPITHSKCCRYYQKPTCCEPRARKVCAVKDNGLFVVTAWDIDPELEYDVIFCPQPDQSDQYVSCGYTRGDMTCFNRQTSLVLVWVTSIAIFILFPVAFGIFTVHSIRAERREEQQMLEDGLFVKQEVEIQQRMEKKKDERAAAAKATEKEKGEREKRVKQMARMNGRKNASTDIEMKGRKKSDEVIEANGRKKSSGNVEVTSVEANIEVT